ncbi:MAG: hypothetical protein GXO43_05620 [Crenarchaeota archaeon]|nr:hypothetical protein [Thermoproteota archaeon]
MYDTFLKLVREELTTGKLLPLPDAKINDFQDFIKNAIVMLHSTPLETRKFFIEAYKKAIGDADNLLRIRIAKACLGAKYERETFDLLMLASVEKIIEFYKGVMTGMYIMPSREAVVVKFRVSLRINDRSYRPGDIVSIDLGKALGLYILGAVDPVKQPIFDSLL